MLSRTRFSSRNEMSEVIWISSDSERFSDSSSDFEREMVEAKRRSLLDCVSKISG